MCDFVPESHHPCAQSRWVVCKDCGTREYQVLMPSEAGAWLDWETVPSPRAQYGFVVVMSCALVLLFYFLRP